MEVERVITVFNKGDVILQWGFVPKNQTLISGFNTGVMGEITPPWLTVTPASGVVPPGESGTISFRVNLNHTSLKETVLSGRSSRTHNSPVTHHLRAVLIFRVANGKDIFLATTVKYLPSCFGKTLAKLVSYPYPVRNSTPHPTLRLLIPKEVHALVDWLYSHALDQRYLFLEGGTPSEMRSVRDCLDLGIPLDTLPALHPDSVAECLLKLLGSFGVPLIPHQLYGAAYTAGNNFAQVRQVLSRLADAHYNLFHYLILFLRELLRPQHAAKNKLTPESLGTHPVFLIMFLKLGATNHSFHFVFTYNRTRGKRCPQAVWNSLCK